jgi:hypothetical protein
MSGKGVRNEWHLPSVQAAFSKRFRATSRGAVSRAMGLSRRLTARTFVAIRSVADAMCAYCP